ncbi:MAG: Bug family tripartite tricarboxylate transporter substrate binding protein [Xanthobacteraceae bacterium]
MKTGLAAAFLAVLATISGGSGGAHAQAYPSRPVTMIVPFPAGGSTDWLTRLLGLKLEQRLKGPFVVENKPGGATVIAATAVANAAPDGYTLLMTTSTTMAINVSVFKNLRYDPVKDLTPVALVSGVPFVLVINPSLLVQSVADLVKLAKSKPGGINYASTGPGSAANLYAVLLMNALGIKMTPIPYKGNAPGLQDTIAGHVSLMFSDVLSALPHIRSGKLRALGLSTKQRVDAAPELKPLAEVGVPGYDASAWQMIVAPGKTPKDIVGKLNAELNAIVREPPTSREINGRGHIAVVTPPPDELQRFVKSEIARWRKVVEQAGALGSQ